MKTFNFIITEAKDGKYKAKVAIVHNGKVYGTYTTIDDIKRDTVLELFEVMYDTMQDTIEVLNEQEN